ncbi:anhydro-N-acetylmuramic acid kinase [Arthrobacter sp. H5]|uniref:anhydro-N-acetylmuramic acid kinase n=1 Tax=Arthrobacter sp. H5 TaxID=1267973 RepID=UPI001C1E51DB|nr:anhydro-N-acetylmuramic acid kinase [Arthrobacter sp. H5]
MSLQSGTSADGIDVCVVDITRDGDALSLQPVAFRTRPWPEALRTRILDVCSDTPTTTGELTQLHALLGREFASAALETSATLDHGSDAVELVVSHGQTVHHWVEGGVAQGTLQLGEPSWIAEATGIPVLANLRSADIAAGGHGAPLMGMFDRLWLSSRAAQSGHSLAAVNLGGIANLTAVHPDGTVGCWDTGPASCLLDPLVQRATDGAQTYDDGGQLALAGSIHNGLLAELTAHPHFHAAPPKSTGRETFTLGWVDSAVDKLGLRLPVQDLAATLTKLTAVTIADSVPQGTQELIASGGGVHNQAMLRAISRLLEPAGTLLSTSASHGVAPDAKESYLFALLGYLSWHGLPATLPALTGARSARVLGQFVPGHSPLSLPAPVRAVNHLTVALPDLLHHPSIPSLEGTAIP